MVRIGINGFGRMGRLAFRAAWDLTDIAVVHINEVKGGAATAAHLLELCFSQFRRVSQSYYALGSALAQL